MVNGLGVVRQNYTNNHIAAIPKPFWVAGQVDGNNLSIISSSGRYDFSASRASGQTTGVYYIAFNTHCSDAKYVINTTNQATGHRKVWDATLPTASGCHIVIYNVSNAVATSIFHFQ